MSSSMGEICCDFCRSRQACHQVCHVSQWGLDPSAVVSREKQLLWDHRTYRKSEVHHTRCAILNIKHILQIAQTLHSIGLIEHKKKAGKQPLCVGSCNGQLFTTGQKYNWSKTEVFLPARLIFFCRCMIQNNTRQNTVLMFMCMR